MLFASSPPILFSLLLLLLSWGDFALGDEITIITPQGLIDFSISVNSGNAYSGTTVYLGSDIDFFSFSQEFIPIGNSSSKYFNGTFDGQGHVISNLSLTSSLQFVGIFGYSIGGIIKNVVLDASCSIIGSYKPETFAGVGSIVGHCELCLIENVVNMASVAFIGIISNNYNLFLSGIVGRFFSSNTIRNCANYGSVTHSGITSGGTYIGGIVGICTGDEAKSIQNCANYGTITHNGTTTKDLYMGGIVGNNWWGTVNIKNCLSAGKIINLTSASGSNAIGNIVGYTKSGSTTSITNCLWTSDVGHVTVCGKNGGTTNITNSSLTELNTATMNELNTYANSNSWDKWFMLHLNGGNINSDISQETLIVIQKHFPDPVKEGRTFSFWCTDTECTEKYNPETTDITEITDLYAVWDINVVIFDFGNGTNVTKVVKYGEKYGELPEIEEKEGYTFNGWFTAENGNGKEIASETTVSNTYTTIYAHWTVNNYTITFIFGNDENDEIRVFNYSDLVVYPDDPVKEGFIFNGWDKNITNMPSHNLNITARWIINKTTNSSSGFVEIVFGNKDLSKEEIEAIISEYTDEKEFTIERIEIDEETGEAKVVIKFIDEKIAEGFVRTIKTTSDTYLKSIIVRVNFTTKPGISFSPSFFPLLFNCIFM